MSKPNCVVLIAPNGDLNKLLSSGTLEETYEAFKKVGAPNVFRAIETIKNKRYTLIPNQNTCSKCDHLGCEIIRNENCVVNIDDEENSQVDDTQNY